jgi:hypothetical protein
MQAYIGRYYPLQHKRVRNGNGSLFLASGARSLDTHTRH